jgi:signal transduction histidine kinase
VRQEPGQRDLEDPEDEEVDSRRRPRVSRPVERLRHDHSDGIEEEIESIENYVEQVLFYARSNAVEKDYVIRKIKLEKPVYAALKRNSKLIIGAGISVTAQDLDFEVFSDAKWLEFILSQMLINSVKYARDNEARIEISAASLENGCLLKISDNGIGIPEHDLPRIFDKGFTGTNGRLRGKSTGMGLYICNKLCERLGITLSAESSLGSGTTLLLVFPKSSMLDIL